MVDCQLGGAKACAAWRLYFAEDHECPPPCDDVQLDTPRTNVAGFDAIPSRREVLGCALLALGAEGKSFLVNARFQPEAPRDRGVT